MKKWLCVLFLPLLISWQGCTSQDQTMSNTDLPFTPSSQSPTTLVLPEPRMSSDFSLEEVLLQRRSIREYSASPLKLADVSQLLWAAQGITAENGARTAPSAGGLYPLEIYAIIGRVEGLTAGVYKYKPQEHQLVLSQVRDIRQELSTAALGQAAVREGAIVIVITAVFERTTRKYGERGIRYVHMEAGHAAQNIYLQATALGLGTVSIGSFIDQEVVDLLRMPENESPLYVIPAGMPAS